MDPRGVVLVVDPDEQTRAAARVVAERTGNDVVAVDDATALIDQLTERPRLAVVEVDLAGELNGFDVLSALHDRFGADLPVILVSGVRTAPPDRVAGLLLGADDYVLKPFDSGEFRARLRRFLRRSDRPDATLIGPHDGLNLSDRDRQILALLAAGHPQQEIATKLLISPNTVATHLHQALVKLNADGDTNAVTAPRRLRVADTDDQPHPT
jgi:DNA-binding NarL/FixJ family response regulator